MIYLILIGLMLLPFLIAAIRTWMLPGKTTDYRPSQDEVRAMDYAEKLARMIRVETISRRGQPDPEKFRRLHAVMEENFPNVFRTCEKIEIDGNLMVKWKGKTNMAPILLMSHLDVVEAPGQWKHPPFSGQIIDGQIWGRGTADTKGSVMCFYQAVEELIGQGYVPECDVYLSGSCTEEIGGDGAPKLVQWLKDHGVKLFLLCDEGGCISESPMPGVKGHFASIGVFEKGYGDLKFIARSTGGHAATPVKGTPIPRLAKFIDHVERHDPFTSRFCPAVNSMFANLAPYAQSFRLKMVMHNLWLFRPMLKKLLPKISPMGAAMLKTTIAFTMQSGSAGANVLPQEASVTANLRFIPHQSTEESVAIMKALAARYGLETEVITAGTPSTPLDLKGEPYALVTQAISEVFPGVGIMPYVVCGGTDARFYGEVCDNCIRFAPMSFTPEQQKSPHSLNEHININTLPDAVDWYRRIITLQEGRK